MGVKPFLAHWRDALRDSDLLTRAKVTGLVLSTYMNAKGEAFPSKTTLARGASQSVRTTDAAIDDLEHDGYVRIVKSKGRRSWNYTATLPLNVAVAAGFNVAAVARLNGQPGNVDASTWQLTTNNPAAVADESGSKAKAKAKDTKDTSKRNPLTVEQVRKNVADLQEMVTGRFPLPPRIAKELHTEIVNALYMLPMSTIAAELSEPLKALHALRQSVGKSGFDGRQGEGLAA